MAVRSGAIDDWDDFDKLGSLVGSCSGISKYEAGELIPKVQRLLEAGVRGSEIAVSQQGVCIYVIELDRARIAEIVRSIGLQDRASILTV